MQIKINSTNNQSEQTTCVYIQKSNGNFKTQDMNGNTTQVTNFQNTSKIP